MRWLYRTAFFLLLTVFLQAGSACADEYRGNRRISSYEDARKLLFEKIYRSDPERTTVYCGFRFDRNRNVELPYGFPIDRYPKRAGRAETEHIVPAENFGRAFPEWRSGSPICVNDYGQPYKGRKCAEEASKLFRLMEADMHNLWPAVGSVNAARSNYNFTDMGIPVDATTFGPTCPMAVEGRKVQPPRRSRGVIARAYLYMEWAYPLYRMSSQQRKLMEAWNQEYPPTNWECDRNLRIERIQGNSNPFIDRMCIRHR